MEDGPMQTRLSEGQMAPEFDLPDGEEHRQRLMDYRGKRVLLYFYGRDDTPG
jgi:thioredoxin-dependent peroxiredoxin